MVKTFRRAIAVLLSALMIATALPFTAITAMAADSVTYNFTGTGECSNAYKAFSENGHTYDIWGASGSGWTDGTVLTLQNSACMFVNDGTVREYFQDGAFSVVFKGRHHAETNRVLATVSSNEHVFIRLDANGDFYVNDSKATIDLAGGANNTYAFSYDGANTVELYVNGIKRATVNETLDIPNDGTRYVSLGWADNTMGDKMDNASFDFLTVSNGTYDPSTFVAGKKASATSAGGVKVGTATGRFYNYETPNYYSNLLFCSNDVVWSGNGSSDTTVTLSNINYKICFPSSVVMMYDGKTAPSFPAKMECKSTDTGKTRCYVYIDSAKDYLTFKKNWIMNTRAWDNWDLSVTEDTTGYSSDNGLRSNENQAANKNTSRFWYNNAYYNVDLSNDISYVKFTDVAFTCHLNSNWDATYVDTHNTVNNNRGQFYVVNYKPIADIYGDVKKKVADVASKCDGYYVNADEFYSVASYLLNLDPNAYGYGNTYYDVLACAQDIKEAVIDYNAVELVKHTHVEGEAQQEDVVPATASKDGSYNTVVRCTVCNEILSSVPGTSTKNGDYTAYNTAVTNANAEVEKTDVYTETSINALKSALAAAKTKADNAVTQADIDDATATIEIAISELVAKGYTVTVSVEKNNDVVDSFTVTKQAGDVYTYSTAGADKLYKATINDKKILSSATSFSVVVTKDTNITVYLANDAVTDNVITATFKAMNGKVIGIEYCADETSLEAAKTKVNAPMIPLYSFVGWRQASKTSNSVVYEAVYDVKNVDGHCNVVGVNVLVKNKEAYLAQYDEIIGVNASNASTALAMYADEDCQELLAYVDSTSYIHAPHRSEVYVMAVEHADEYVGITGSYSYIDEAGMQTVAFNGNKIGNASKVGVLATVSSALAYNDEKFVSGTKGVVDASAERTTEIGEFTVAIHSNFGKYTKVYAKPYMVVGGTTIYGNVVELDIAQINA